MKNLFKNSIENNEYVSFAFGEGQYFIQDREYDEHWVLGSWVNHILPYSEGSMNSCKSELLVMFEEILNTSNYKIEEVAENLLYHIYVFHYLVKERGLNELNGLLDGLNDRIITFILNYRKEINSFTKIMELKNSIKMIKSKGGLSGLIIEDLNL